MRCVVQRVREARVEVGGEVVAEIGRGLLVLAALFETDTNTQVVCMADRVSALRVFDDTEGKMNLALADIDGSLLVVPNFTVAASCSKGRRPSFDAAMPPTKAREMFPAFVDALRNRAARVEQGVFGADMKVSLVNDGPVTLVVESP